MIYDIAKEYDSAKVLPLESRKDVLLPIFKKFKRKIPNYKRYFLTSKETIENESEEMSNLLEDGLTKEASSGSATKMYLVVGGLILLGLFIFFFIRFRR